MKAETINYSNQEHNYSMETVANIIGKMGGCKEQISALIAEIALLGTSYCHSFRLATREAREESQEPKF